MPGAIGSDATDLDVFRQVFNDPEFQESDLPGLVESFDVHLDLGLIFDLLNLSSVQLGFGQDGAWYLERVMTEADSLSLFTLPCDARGYVLEIEFDGPLGHDWFEFGQDPEMLALLPGEDVWIEPFEFYEIDPKAAFLHLCYEDDGALESVPLDLVAHGIQPGDFLLIDQVGSYDGGGGWVNLEKWRVCSARPTSFWGRIISTAFLAPSTPAKTW